MSHLEEESKKLSSQSLTELSHDQAHELTMSGCAYLVIV